MASTKRSSPTRRFPLACANTTSMSSRIAPSRRATSRRMSFSAVGAPWGRRSRSLARRNRAFAASSRPRDHSQVATLNCNAAKPSSMARARDHASSAPAQSCGGERVALAHGTTPGHLLLRPEPGPVRRERGRPLREVLRQGQQHRARTGGAHQADHLLDPRPEQDGAELPVARRRIDATPGVAGVDVARAVDVLQVEHAGWLRAPAGCGTGARRAACSPAMGATPARADRATAARSTRSACRSRCARGRRPAGPAGSARSRAPRRARSSSAGLRARRSRPPSGHRAPPRRGASRATRRRRATCCRGRPPPRIRRSRRCETSPAACRRGTCARGRDSRESRTAGCARAA